ncbi:ABC transporter substrate-binding protein [Sinanaerobacter chloroacetimidivorans]|jgi:branched-chain amino acid transport system substrate-binding protein|uniref:ABC transporter substrate-binding protein n=1 Tax=Sinanaerobacter chloroacetimidivorans TaxID=2818044 RepID=A0A8J7VYS1_9FIRM|nr:ABC transporter substrate-binding protein [Sinanaerobacter chloroacetimidivorans]MBR0597582.1 ABC transporter substrate-binding protein [Sinanaerobacter chloroacetimidivorans]
MKRFRKIMAMLLAFAMIFSFAACGGGEKEPAEETINIGALYNLTGGQASLDQPSYNGFKLAADQINANGGINGKLINVVSYDGKTEQTTVANNTKKMIDVDKCVVVAGLSDSNYALAAGNICQEKGIPFITSGATLPTLPDQVGDFAFLAPFGDNVQAYAAADYAFDDLGLKKCYLLTDQSMEFTKTLAHFFEERYTANGGEIVLKDNYMNKDPDFSAQIDRFIANKGGAEIIFISGVPDDAGVVVKQLRDKGVTLPIISGDGFDTPLLIEIAGDAANDTYVGTHASLDNQDPLMQDFIAAYKEAYGVAPENAFAGLGYDTMYLIADALSRASDPADPAAIRDAIAATEGLKGVTGTVTYENGSHVPTKSVTINKVEDGKFVFMKEVFLK